MKYYDQFLLYGISSSSIFRYPADDTVLVAETKEHLQHIVSEFERACEGMGLKIKVGKR